VWLLNNDKKSLPRLTPVAMARKFDTKFAITLLPRSFRLIGVFVFGVESLNDINPDIILKDLKEQ